MRRLTLILVAALALGCTPTGVERAGTDRAGVERLDLRDSRLPIEARRWLADAEDEVAIARAQVSDAETELVRLNHYGRALDARLKDAWTKGAAKAKAQGEKARDLFRKFSKERVALAELQLQKARLVLDLAGSRLTQARAETAVRYDVSVYEIEPIAREVERLKEEVAALRRKVEQQRAGVEKTALMVWQAFSRYATQGGVTSALWETSD
jgi:hypothetical protein